MTRRHDYRSDEAKAYRTLYSTAAWKRTRAEQLRREPLCRYCLEVGRTTAASVVDHRNPHRGDREAFFAGPFDSCCKQCHDATKQRIEVGGYDSAADADGYPMSPDHPVNRPR